MTAEEQTQLLIRCVENEIRLGTKHMTATWPYRSLNTVHDVLAALTSNDGVIIEPVPERKHLFISYNQYLRRIARLVWMPRRGRAFRMKKRNPAVDHPAHYNKGRFEVWDVIVDWGLDWLSGDAVKYIARAAHKGNEIQDLRKAVAYLNKRIETLEQKQVSGRRRRGV